MSSQQRSRLRIGLVCIVGVVSVAIGGWLAAIGLIYGHTFIDPIAALGRGGDVQGIPARALGLIWLGLTWLTVRVFFRAMRRANCEAELQDPGPKL